MLYININTKNDPFDVRSAIECLKFPNHGKKVSRFICGVLLEWNSFVQLCAKAKCLNWLMDQTKCETKCEKLNPRI
jgi:hypothetical protein